MSVALNASGGEVVFPSSDGEPLAEKDPHRLVLTHTIEALSQHFAARPDVYVSGNLLVFYDPEDVNARVSPDVFVVVGVPKKPRDNYKVWMEGRPPDAVFEITSYSSRLSDKGIKKSIYEELGVAEYFLFDPLGEYLQPRLQGFRLTPEGYVRMVGEVLECSRLGLLVEADDWMLRLRDPATGERLPTPPELAAAVEEMSGQLAVEKAARAEAEARANREETRANREAEARVQAEKELRLLRG